MASFPDSLCGSPPPLLALPAELKLNIISHLPHDEYPSLACLRRTHSSFLELIPKSHIRSSLSDTELSDQLLKTELEYAYLLPHGHYPCYICARVLPLDAFYVKPVCTSGNEKGHEPRRGPRSCRDCCMLKKRSYRRSFVESLIWIGFTFEELPMPPSRPRLRSPTAATVKVFQNELKQYLSSLEQQAQNHGKSAVENDGLIGAE